MDFKRAPYEPQGKCSLTFPPNFGGSLDLGKFYCSTAQELEKYIRTRRTELLDWREINIDVREDIFKNLKSILGQGGYSDVAKMDVIPFHDMYGRGYSITCYSSASVPIAKVTETPNSEFSIALLPMEPHHPRRHNEILKAAQVLGPQISREGLTSQLAKLDSFTGKDTPIVTLVRRLLNSESDSATEVSLFGSRTLDMTVYQIHLTDSNFRFSGPIVHGVITLRQFHYRPPGDDSYRVTYSCGPRCESDLEK